MMVWVRAPFSELLAVGSAGEHAHQRVVAQRLAAPLAPAADQEHPRAVGTRGPFAQHVVVQRAQRPVFQQVDDPVPARLLPHLPGTVIALADGDPPPSVGDVLQPQTEHLAGPQAPFPHHLLQRPVPPGAQTVRVPIAPAQAR